MARQHAYVSYPTPSLRSARFLGFEGRRLNNRGTPCHVEATESILASISWNECSTRSAGSCRGCRASAPQPSGGWMTLTIGFGDLTPKTTTMKVLTFPFTIIIITLLALIVTSIVRLLADRARRRKLELKKSLKKKVSEKKRIHSGYGSKLRPWSARSSRGDAPRLKRSLTLQEELRKLREDDWKREPRANLNSMLIGFTVFLIFWCIGAVIFDLVEVHIPASIYVDIHHSLGVTAILSTFVTCSSHSNRVNRRFFLTIGFGDFYPSTEAGKPIFIVYALLAVPTMTIIGSPET